MVVKVRYLQKEEEAANKKQGASIWLLRIVSYKLIKIKVKIVFHSNSYGVYDTHYTSSVEDWDGGNNGGTGDFAVMGRTIPSFRIALAIEK